MDLVSETLAWLTDPANWSGPASIPVRLVEHVALSGASLLIAIAVALPIGLWTGHTHRGMAFAANLANLGRALPSLAVIALVLPITAAIDPELGFKIYPAVIAMVVLAIPPILVNAQAGIAGVDADLVEAGRAMGMHGDQLVRRLEIPVGLPVILGGVRSAAFQVVATLTLAAIFGGPGLGRYLVEGIAQSGRWHALRRRGPRGRPVAGDRGGIRSAATARRLTRPPNPDRRLRDHRADRHRQDDRDVGRLTPEGH